MTVLTRMKQSVSNFLLHSYTINWPTDTTSTVTRRVYVTGKITERARARARGNGNYEGPSFDLYLCMSSGALSES